MYIILVIWVMTRHIRDTQELMTEFSFLGQLLFFLKVAVSKGQKESGKWKM